MKKLISILLIIQMLISSGVSNVFASNEDDIQAILTKIRNANTTSTYDANKLNTLYGVGESNLTNNDVITINGVDYYLLQVDSTNNKAELMAKNIYDVRFDDGGHTCICTNGTHDASNTDCVMNYVGNSGGSYTDKTYNYAYSTLKTWMDSFYNDHLSTVSQILETQVTSFYDTKYNNDFNTTSMSLVSQYVFALDAEEAKTYGSKFGSSSWDNYNASCDSSYTTANCWGFYVSGGYKFNKYSYGFYMHYKWELFDGFVDNSAIGARPCFWIDLTEPSSNTNTNTPTSSSTSGTTSSTTTTTQTTINETKTYKVPNTCGD